MISGRLVFVRDGDKIMRCLLRHSIDLVKKKRIALLMCLTPLFRLPNELSETTMPIPAYMWLKDDGGSPIKGSVSVQGREGSIEIIGFGHGLTLPVDGNAGRITGTRIHAPMSIEKEFDAASPYLYKAVAKGQTLRSAEIRFYRINDAGREENYFTMLLEGVKVAGVHPGFANTKIASMSPLNHVEAVSLMYDNITWHYLDGNIKFSDAWTER
jgi:type VI secretion system secreted protein Hcp